MYICTRTGSQHLGRSSITATKSYPNQLIRPGSAGTTKHAISLKWARCQIDHDEWTNEMLARPTSSLSSSYIDAHTKPNPNELARPISPYGRANTGIDLQTQRRVPSTYREVITSMHRDPQYGNDLIYEMAERMNDEMPIHHFTRTVLRP